MGDRRNYLEYRTEMTRWKYEKEIETVGRSNIYLIGISDGKKRESNIWRGNG